MLTSERKPFFHGADRAVDSGDDKAGKDSKSKGDGLHHHELHEDEGGGYHSVHTHPDGRKEHGDYATYEDGRDHMDEKFGHGEDREESADDGSGNEGGGDMDADDIAGSYGRAGSCE